MTPVIARAFEKIVYYNFSQEAFEKQVTKTQHGYRKSGSCVETLSKVQHFSLKALDDSNGTVVKLFAMDFSKAFVSVNHKLLGNKLKLTTLNLDLINWDLSFLKDREQRVVHDGKVCEWIAVNKGTTQGSFSGPHLFNVFLNDLYVCEQNKATLDKYANESTTQVVV